LNSSKYLPIVVAPKRECARIFAGAAWHRRPES
jgi:hypothetical protein